ncbi:MAG: ATP-binding cassette domain-containing protein [Devosia sp.]|nr:ATP-binding cassette domain-containing protein [Devosia sp.]
MKQRACIAIAICLRPKVIIADEPTSALDVVVQRQVMETLARVQRDLGCAIILVGHDMGLMAQFVDRLGVMYAGRLVELAPIGEIITRPRHPYTQALIASLPSLEARGTFQGLPGLAPRCCACRAAAPSTRAAPRWTSASGCGPAVARDRRGRQWPATCTSRSPEHDAPARSASPRSSAPGLAGATPALSDLVADLGGDPPTIMRWSARAAAARPRWRCYCWACSPAAPARSSTAAGTSPTLRRSGSLPARGAGGVPGSVRGVQPVLHRRPPADGADESSRLALSRSRGAHLMDEAPTAVGLRPEEILGRFPHQLSGGQRQRIMVARAVLMKPKLIVADEPVSMVDASLRANILSKALSNLNKQDGVSIISSRLTTAYHRPVDPRCCIAEFHLMMEARRGRRGDQGAQSTYTHCWSVDPLAQPRPALGRRFGIAQRAGGRRSPTMAARSGRGTGMPVLGCTPAAGRGRSSPHRLCHLYDQAAAGAGGTAIRVLPVYTHTT